jgi:hypothetical protein
MDSSLRPPTGAALAVSVALACAGLQAGEHPAAEQEVRAVEERWLSNESRPEVVESILADDFIHVLSAGFIDKNEHLQYLKQHPGAFPGIKQFDEVRIRIYGETASLRASSEPIWVRAAQRGRRSPMSLYCARESGWRLMPRSSRLAQGPTRPGDGDDELPRSLPGGLMAGEILWV